MKFSEQWLRSLVDPDVTQQDLIARLSMAGLEVDSVEPVAGIFSGVVVGEIVSAEQHPDADKLRVCQVSNGKETLQVVCGAPNAREGIKIPFALIGAKLPGDFAIKKAKLRGVESFGMLCSASELEISDDSSGLLELALDAPVGTDIRHYLSLDDISIEVDLTPNRGDCLSMRGIAREVGALYNAAVSDVNIKTIAPSIDEKVEISLENPEACPRYLSRIIRQVDVTKPTPIWMVERLRRAGIRSIDAVVDVTNYVMIELGQPMHAFDLSEIDKGIIVRNAKENEVLTLLNGQHIKLRTDTLLIADHTKPLAIAGIMGGEHSGINANTKDLLLESAFFSPIKIAGKARSYGLHTDASHRFERGVDWQLAKQAIERATELLLEIVGGAAGPVSEAVNQEYLPKTTTITLRSSQIKRMLGIELAVEQVEQLLKPLGLELQSSGHDEWLVTVPSYRYDLTIEVDLLEEIARLYGYNKLPVSYPQARLAPHANRKEAYLDKYRLRDLLVDRGYQEAITYSFIDPKWFKLFTNNIEPLALANPISQDLSVMRQSLWPGLIKAAQYNLNRQQNRVRLFEIGLCFAGQLDSLKQSEHMAGLITGKRNPESWTNDNQLSDFYDIKADVEAILWQTGMFDQYCFKSAEHCALHPGQTALIEKQGEIVGYVGALHPELAKMLGIDQPIYLFELFIQKIKEGMLPTFKELSRFPEVRRDLALVVDKAVTADELLSAIRQVAGEFLVSTQLFDVYQGKGMEPNQKSVAVGITWQHPEKTLNDDEINAFLQNIMSALERQCNATLRK